MDKKKILEDGLLEQYLLGELSDEQEILIQKVLKEDADLRSIFEGLCAVKKTFARYARASHYALEVNV